MITISQLDEFYKSALGQLVCAHLANPVSKIINTQKKEHLLGIGYPFHLFEALSEKSPGLLLPCLVPRQLQFLPPQKEPIKNITLVEPNIWPTSNEAIDQLICFHGLEFALNEAMFMREVWRILKPEGHLIMIVPNRLSLWARRERSPFSHGRPYSKNQLCHLLEAQSFQVKTVQYLIHPPPNELCLKLFNNKAYELCAKNLWPAFAGLLLVTAKKELMQPISKGQFETVKPKGKFAPTQATN